MFHLAKAVEGRFWQAGKQPILGSKIALPSVSPRGPAHDSGQGQSAAAFS